MVRKSFFGLPRCLWILLLPVCCSLLGTQASGQERLCDSSFEDCRTPIWNLINSEQQEIDVAFWFMQDSSYANMIVNRFNAGVKVRVIVDPRANPTESGNQQILNQLAAAGIPMRYKVADCILHWKMILFAGQNTVQFSGADYGPFFFAPATPYQNYIDESIYFSTDSQVVNSFKTQYDNLWTDTVNYGNYANISGSPARSYPTYSILSDMNFPPDNTNPLNDFGSRTVDVISQENQKIDADIYRVTNTMFTNASINAVSRGVPMRLLVEPEEYRNPARLWDSYNVDLMYMGGVQIKQTKHQGLNHQKSVLLYGQGMTVWGSSNWTGPSADCQAEHNYFNTSKPWFFKWFQNQFERKWNSTVEYEPFIPLAPDPATNIAPANNATAQPLTVTLNWDGGNWSHKFDIYFGTSATPPLIANDVFTGDPTVTGSPVFQVSGLRPNTVYHWQIVDKTMANLTAAGPVWAFTTGTGPNPSTTSSITSVSPASAGTSGGVTVNIGGSGFASGAAVVVGNVLATNTTVTNSSSITAVVPSHAAGAFDVMVVNSDGGNATLPGAFNYVPPPIPAPHASLIAPSSGPPAGGTSVTIEGFDISPSASVQIGGVAAASISVTNGVTITATTPAGALGSADVVVTNSDGQSCTLPHAFTYSNPAGPPQISSISPSSGPVNASTQVTITGTGFQYGATVTFGNTMATTTIVYGATTITAYARPASAGGPVNVVVTNYDGQTATVQNGFTYNGSAPPAISSISPASGTTAGGTFIQIDGTGFSSGTSVTIGGSAASIVSTASTSIVATTPPHAAAVVDVVVSNSAGQATLPGGYTYTTTAPPPSISSVTPNSGSTGGGTVVTISGTGFTAGATVKFGNLAATNVTAASGSSINATAPAQSPATVDVTLTNTDGQSATLTSAFTYSSGQSETVLLADNFDSNSISPSNWSTGNLFSGTTDPAVSVAAKSQQLQIGPLDQNTGGSHYDGLRSASTFNFTGAYCSVELVTPPASNTLADAMLTVGTDVNDYYRICIEGGNLIGQRKAGGTKTTLFTQAYNPVNDNFIRIRHDSAAGTAVFEVAPNNSGTPGSWTQVFSETWNTSIPLTMVIFEMKAGTWQSESNAPGTVAFDNFRAAVPDPPAPAPTVSGVSPSSGPTAGATSVTISGTGFQAGASASFGGTAASAVTVNGATSITATTPSHAAGAVNVIVTNPDGQSGTLAAGYTYTSTAPGPTVSSVSPATGPASGNTSVTITGTGFGAGATVSLGGATASNVNVSNSTTITAATPAHAGGTVSVVVTNSDGQSGTLTNGFTYTNPPPTVSSVSPSSGSTAGGTTVSVNGTGFLTGSGVSFGGTAATGVTVNSGSSITATTPANSAGVVNVIVTDPDGQSATLTNGFTYSTPTETVLLADNFSSNQIDQTKWSTNDLFSGLTDTAVPVAVKNQQLQIGPLDLNTTGSHYNGLRSVQTFNFTGAYCYIEVLTPPASNTAADTMLTIGTDVNNYYRIYVEGGTLYCQRKAAGVKTTLFSETYNATNARFLRIRHDGTAGHAVFEVASDNGGIPGAWTQLFSETWNSSIPLTGIIFEIKAGTWQSEANAPGTVAFGHFRASVPQ